MSQEKVLDTEKERVANVKLAGDGQGGKWGSAVPAELDPELPGWLNRWVGGVVIKRQERLARPVGTKFCRACNPRQGVWTFSKGNWALREESKAEQGWLRLVCQGVPQGCEVESAWAGAGGWAACVGTGAVRYRQRVMTLRHGNVKDRGKGTEG